MKLDSSSDTDSSSENTYCSSEEDYLWQRVEKKITKCKVNVTFKGPAEMVKDDIKTLKEHIYIKRRQVNSYDEIKFSLSENNLMVHVYFDQQDAIRSAYFGNQCFRIFTACCYAESPNND